jgi:hypothetical protein
MSFFKGTVSRDFRNSKLFYAQLLKMMLFTFSSIVSITATYCQKMFHFLHTTILTMCTAKKVNLNLEAKAPLRCRLS